MRLREYLHERALLVNQELERWLPEELKPEVLAKASRHLIKAGGKRLRPCLTIASCEAVGGKKEDALEAAAAIEMLHNFTLIHDDIMDKDEFRRNVKTVHAQWGEPIAIIAGDALFSKVFEALAANASRLKLPAEQTAELFKTISRASFEICQGQTLDMLFEGRSDVSEQEYMQMVSAKTGALMEASARIGVMLGGGTPEQVEALAGYGRLMGIAFQIRDDVLGVVGEQEKFGKPVGSDLREGKCTLMVIHALAHASPEDAALLKRVLKNPEAEENELRAAIEVLKRTGSIEHANEKAQSLAREAKSKLKPLPESEAKSFLLELADFSVQREF